MRFLFLLALILSIFLVGSMASCGDCCTGGSCLTAFRGADGICCGVRTIDNAFSRPFCCPTNARCIDDTATGIFKCQLIDGAPAPIGSSTASSTVAPGTSGTSTTVTTTPTGTSTTSTTTTTTGTTTGVASTSTSNPSGAATTSGSSLAGTAAGLLPVLGTAAINARPVSSVTTRTPTTTTTITTTPVSRISSTVRTAPEPKVKKSGMAWWKILLITLGAIAGACLLAWGIYRLVDYCRYRQSVHHKVIIPHNHGGGRHVPEDVRF